jgi:hypothetical protein
LAVDFLAVDFLAAFLAGDFFAAFFAVAISFHSLIKLQKNRPASRRVIHVTSAGRLSTARP